MSPLLSATSFPTMSLPSLALGLEVRSIGLVLAQAVPLGHRLAGALADLSPVLGATGCDTVRPQDQPPHHLVLGGAIKVDDEELNADVGQEVSGDVIDERLIEDWVQSALLHVGFLLGNALSAIVDVHLDIRIWGHQRDKTRKGRQAYDTVLSSIVVVSCWEEGVLLSISLVAIPTWS